MHDFLAVCISPLGNIDPLAYLDVLNAYIVYNTKNSHGFAVLYLCLSHQTD